MPPVKALIFDVLGTTVDWRSSVVAEFEAMGQKHGVPSGTDWGKLAQQWRANFMKNIYHIALGGSGTLNVDTMHKEMLDELLLTPEWSHIGPLWDESTRKHLVHVWHCLKGWPDSVKGLYALKKQVIVVGLSNGNLSLLIDMAKNADLPWDALLSTEMFNTFKPNSKVYSETLRHLSLPPENCFMVACHMFDLRGAASVGIPTIYVRRPDENPGEQENVKSKKEGGEVDYVVDSFVEIVDIIAAHNA
ncbi:hypothetical protein GALMADRAFT_228275 [Galerina marginata CBS 339.88]|uniref:Haloacid dehalogenase n=1 Tax=Galerina marginata (strain CBS 339.88) TaxID=685588 RepID=A0A067SSV1_GALM3|nr:hypothetical protein GALMADRAFT_228275 [Galerina marginata CBS 339.88]